MSRALRIAVPKGRLLTPSLELFAAAGYDVPSESDLRSRRLRFDCGAIEWIFVKDADVPVYVGFGAADAGIAGLDQILEHRADVLQPLALPFGRCRMMLIGAPGVEGGGLPARPENQAGWTPAAPLKIATKYPNITRDFLIERRRHAEIIPLQGSVELAAVLQLAPFIVDLVETGETIRVHELQPLELIAEISPRVIVNRSAAAVDGARIKELIEHLADGGRPAPAPSRSCTDLPRKKILPLETEGGRGTPALQTRSALQEPTPCE